MQWRTFPLIWYIFQQIVLYMNSFACPFKEADVFLKRDNLHHYITELSNTYLRKTIINFFIIFIAPLSGNRCGLIISFSNVEF